MKDGRKTVRLRVKELLEQQGKTAYWLGRQPGITRNRAYEFAKNQADGLRLESIAALAMALNVTPGELFTWPPERVEEFAQDDKGTSSAKAGAS